jgi:hypothetical protein
MIFFLSEVKQQGTHINTVPELRLCGAVALLSHMFIGVLGLDRAVGIATCYRLDSPGVESQGKEIFHTHPEQP